MVNHAKNSIKSRLTVNILLVKNLKWNRVLMRLKRASANQNSRHISVKWIGKVRKRVTRVPVSCQHFLPLRNATRVASNLPEIQKNSCMLVILAQHCAGTARGVKRVGKFWYRYGTVLLQPNRLYLSTGAVQWVYSIIRPGSRRGHWGSLQKLSGVSHCSWGSHSRGTQCDH